MAEQSTHHRIAIVGAGFGGIGLAIRLRQAGIEDFAILERASELGGTWRDNTYPGCACDVASQLYSFSFAPNPDWSHAYSRQPEILDYLRAVAREHGIERFIRYETAVLESRWDDERRVWALDTSRGPQTAQILVTATGPFGDPVIPDIPGLERFAGTSFHSLHWDHDHDLTGKRVAVIGTGASAVQFVPRIQPHVGRLLVFQRTPPWILPRLDRPIPALERRLLARIPLLRNLQRGLLYGAVESLGLAIFVDRRFRHVFEGLGRLQLRRQVADPALRRALTPDYAIGCKRAILSDDYLPALTQPNVDVITDRIVEVREHGIVTAAGAADGTAAADRREHPVDTVVLGTGFAVPHDGTARVFGRDGRSALDVHSERPQSYKGTALAGFPNLFTLLGAFAAAGNQSALYMLESQMTYIVDALRTMRERGAEVIEVRPEAQEAFTAEAERRSVDTVWLQGGCSSYYQTPDGRNVGLWPGWTFEYRRRTRRFDSEAYELLPA